jgi:tyrosine-protein kinase Etk/Wzc
VLKESMYQETYQSEMAPIQVEPQRGLDLLDVLLIFARRKWLLLAFTLAGGLAVMVWSLLQQDLYQADAVIMTPQDSQSSSALMGQLSVLSALGGMGGAAKSPSDIYVGLLKTRSVGEKLVRDFKLQDVYHADKVRDAEGLLTSRTKIAADKDGLITITVADRDADRAKNLANAYSKGLYALNSTLAIGQAAQRRLFFDQQLAIEKDHLADAEVALKQVEEQTGMIQLSGQTSITISRVSQLQADITNLEIQLAALRASATEDNPDVVRLESQLAGLREQLKAMVGKPGKAGSDLPDSLGIPSSKVPGLSLEYIRKERDVEYHQTLFDLLARQLEAARIDEAKAAPIVQLVDPAETPDKPYFPKVGLFTLLGAIGGFVLGCIRCVVLYVYDYVDEEPRLHIKMWAVKTALRGRIP